MGAAVRGRANAVVVDVAALVGPVHAQASTLLRRTRALTGQHHRAAELELDGAIGLGVHAHDGRRVRGADAAVVALPALRGRAGQAEPRQRERGGPALAAVAD